jgi:hypothetical protein
MRAFRVFGVLDLTAGEREGVYAAVVSLVRARLGKAQGVSGYFFDRAGFYESA